MKYKSNGPTPSLEDSLKYASNEIFFQYRDRVEGKTRVTYNEFMESLYNIIFKEKISASRLAFYYEFPLNIKKSPTKAGQFTTRKLQKHQNQINQLSPFELTNNPPEPADAIRLAMAFWFEAKVASANDPGRAWAALLQSYYYLGMASSAQTSAEFAAGAGSAKGDETSKELRSIVVTIIDSLRDNFNIKTATAAITRVREEVENDSNHMKILIDFYATTLDQNNAERYRKTLGDHFALLNLFEDLLKKWKNPKSGPYPDVIAAFAHFRKSK